MSRDPRVFEVIEQQAYDQNRDRILVLKASLNGLSRLMSENLLWSYDLRPEENEMIREELLRSLVNSQLNNLSDEQIAGTLDQIEVELESNNDEN